MDVVFRSLHLSSVHLSVMLNPPRQLDQIQPNLSSDMLTIVGHAKAHLLLALPLRALGKGEKLLNSRGFVMACHQMHNA